MISAGAARLKCVDACVAVCSCEPPRPPSRYPNAFRHVVGYPNSTVIQLDLVPSLLRVHHTLSLAHDCPTHLVGNVLPQTPSSSATPRSRSVLSRAMSSRCRKPSPVRVPAIHSAMVAHDTIHSVLKTLRAYEPGPALSPEP
jgi:hypothetical protein